MKNNKTKNKPHDNSNTRGSGPGNIWKNKERKKEPLYSAGSSSLSLLDSISSSPIDDETESNTEETSLPSRVEKDIALIKGILILKDESDLSSLRNEKGTTNLVQSLSEDETPLSLPTKSLSFGKDNLKSFSLTSSPLASLLSGQPILETESTTLLPSSKENASLVSSRKGNISHLEIEASLKEAELSLPSLGRNTNSEKSFNETFSSLQREERQKGSTLDVSNLASFLGTDPSAYSKLTLTQQSIDRMRSHMAAIKHGTYASVPLICKGYNTCPIASTCWFVQKKDDGSPDLSSSVFPLYKPCPVEASILQSKVEQYCTEHVSSPDRITPTIISLATKLAELDIYEIRINMIFSSGDSLGEGRDLLQESSQMAPDGTLFKTSMKEHSAFSLKEKIMKMRSSLMKELVATPEAKINAKNKDKGEEKETSTIKVLQDMSSLLNKIKTQHSKNPLSDHDEDEDN